MALSIFSTIMDKIFHHPAATPASDAAVSPPPVVDSGPPLGVADGTAAALADGAAAPARSIDVGAVLSQMASQKGGGGNYHVSIVGLLKLLDLDSSLAARKQLAGELDVHAGADGSAEENIALLKAVIQKLADNGGVVPASMKG